jgi:hypothetical protein
LPKASQDGIWNAAIRWLSPVREESVTRKKLSQERRKCQRLPLAIPLFIRSHDEEGKDVLEFATALNVSASGMLVAMRRMLPASAQYSLEIPSALTPDLNILPEASRKLQARAVRVIHARDYHLVGIKFSRPLPTSACP